MFLHALQAAKSFSKYNLYLVGSTISGFALNTSDVDMCLVLRGGQTNVDARTEALAHLEMFKDHFAGKFSTLIMFTKLNILFITINYC